MKTLYLVRHAKSEWANEDLTDIDRPLNARGYRDAHSMSMQLEAEGILPDLILASAAIRTTSTALIFARNLRYEASKIHLLDSLYHAPAENYFHALDSVGDDVKSVLLVGHNPTITELSNKLAEPISESLPTCSVVCITFNTKTWKDLKKGKLSFLNFPKMKR